MSRNKKSSWQNHATPTLRHHSQPMFKASKLPCNYLHCLIPQKLGVLQRFFYLFQFEKKETTLLCPFFFCSKATRFFFRFFWLPPGSEIQHRLQGGESQSVIFWVWPLTRCQWPQDHCIFSRGVLYINLHLPLFLGRAHTQLIFQTKKSLNKNLSLG